MTPDIEWGGKEPRWLRVAVYHCVLWPLIKRNRRLRELKELPDKWYWADYLAVQWGYIR